MISKSEYVLTTYYRDGAIIGATTKHKLQDIYFFYEFSGADYIKLGKGSSPLELEERYNVDKRMGISS